jgi:hypothetical protein
MAIAYVYIELPGLTVEEVQEKFVDEMEVTFLILPEDKMTKNGDKYMFVLDDLWEDDER